MAEAVEVDSEKRWERFRENRKNQSTKISKAKISRKRNLTEAEKAAHGKVPLELLAREWLNEQNAGNEMRWYMVETLLPTLVIGLEKLLDEVSMRGLENTTEQQADFNPVNYIAQYLMRNNPRYSNSAEAHPYCSTMRDVSEQLKKIAQAIDEKKLAELRAQTKLRREDRDRLETMKAAEEERRRGLIKEAFLQWMLQSEEEISIGEVKLAVKSWMDLISDHAIASTLPDLFSVLLTCEELFMKESQFMSDMMSMTLDLPRELFDSFAHHLSICGVERRSSKLKELRRDLFSRVFSACDPDKTGMVDRHRVLHLFSLFYDSNPTNTQDKLQNPKKWPIVEVIEDEELGEDGEDDDEAISSTATTLLSEEEYQEFLQSGTCDAGGGEGGRGGGGEEVTSASSDAPKEKASSDDGCDGGGSAMEEKSEIEDKDGQKKQEVEDEKTAPKEEDMHDGDEKGEGGVEKTDEKTSSEEAQADENRDGDKTAVETSSAQPKEEDGKAATDQSVDTEVKDGDGSSSECPPPGGSALERRMTAYGRSRAASVSLQRRLSGMSSAHPSEPTGPGHVWDHVMLNCPQFVQLIELFLGPDPEDATVDALSSFIRKNYAETVQERSDRLELARQQALQQSRRSRVSRLFEVWDNDRSGYLELEELQLVLSKWRGFNTQQAIEHAEEVLSSLGALHKRLTLARFRVYIDQLTEDMTLQEFEEFADYLIASVELTFEEQRRGERRRELLAQIQLAGKSSGLKFIHAMKSAVAVIHKDVAEFGGEKHITVGVATLVPLPSSSADNNNNKTSSSPYLEIKAASSIIELAVVGKKLQRRFQRGVSHQAVAANRPVHVANIHKHGGVHFFIPEHRKEEFKGALVVSPIATPRHQVIGTVNVDSLSTYLDDPNVNFDFESHEINFYQGVGVCLGEVYHWIEARQKLLLVAESALGWIHRRCPLVTQAAVYIVEPGKSPTSKKDHYALRCMLLTSASDREGSRRQNQLLRQGENLFRDYLFQCSENSESVSADVYGEHHLAYPIRNHTGCAVAVVDFYMPPAQSLNRVQMREITRVLKLLTLSFYQLSVVPEQRMQADDDSNQLGSTQSLLVGEGAEVDASVLFDQLLLADLQETMAKLDTRVFAEMRSYIEPPELVLKIIQALLNILRPEGEYDSWKQCKKGITLSLIKAMQSYDPLKVTSHPKLDYIKQIMEAVPADSIKSHGSRPAKLIYSWLSICTSLLEHSLSLANASHHGSPPELTLSRSAGSPTASSTPPNSAVLGHDHDRLPQSTQPESAATSRGGSSPQSGPGQEPPPEAAAAASAKGGDTAVGKEQNSKET